MTELDRAHRRDLEFEDPGEGILCCFCAVSAVADPTLRVA